MSTEISPDEAHDPHYQAAPEDESKAFTIDYRKLWETTKKYFWIIILYLIAAVVGAVVYLSNATPIYRSFAKIKVEQRVMAATPNVTGSSLEEDLRGMEMLQTIQLGFVSRSLMQRMVERLNLAKRQDFVRSTELEIESDQENFIIFMLMNTKTDLIQGTRLLTVSFDHPDPQVAQEMVNSLIKEYVALEGEQRLTAASVNLSYLIEEKKSLEDKLEQSRNKLIEYTRKLGSISVDGELNIIASQLIELNSRLAVAKADRIKLESDYEQIEAKKKNPAALLEIASVAQLTEVANLRSQITSLTSEISKTQRRYREGNPATQQLESQLASTREALDAELLRAPETVAQTLAVARRTEEALQKATDEQEKKVIDVKALSIESDKLKGAIDADNLSYQAVLRKLNEETSQARSQPVFIQVVDAACPAFKVKPKPVQVFGIAITAAIVASVLTIFTLASLDTSFKSVDDLEATLGLQVAAAIPLFETKVGKENSPQGVREAIPLRDDPYSAASEAYRTLRASLMLSEDESHRILVTSAVPEEGKSTTSLNLAVAMAARGARTLLVEADLRKPVFEERLFGTQTRRGLADYLSDKADFQAVLLPTDIENLTLVSAGKVSKNSGELVLRRQRVEKFFELASKEFDQVIVDSAPLLAVSDTLTLAKQFKVIALVVRSHRTPRRLVRRAVDLLKRVKRRPAAVALSAVPPGSDYYYYGYSQNGRAYGAERQPEDEDKG